MCTADNQSKRRLVAQRSHHRQRGGVGVGMRRWWSTWNRMYESEPLVTTNSPLILCAVSVGAPTTVSQPMRVEELVSRNERVVDIACGSGHTILCTAIQEYLDGKGVHQTVQTRGGRLYMTGAALAIGRPCSRWVHCTDICSPVKQVAAGTNHSAALTAQGELFLWGSNASGCCGQPLKVQSVARPTRCDALYAAPTNLCLEIDVQVREFSQVAMSSSPRCY